MEGRGLLEELLSRLSALTGSPNWKERKTGSKEQKHLGSLRYGR